MNIYFNTNLKYFISKGVSSAFRLSVLLLLPLVLVDKEYIKYGTIFPILTSISVISGFGFPVTYIKKYLESSITIKEFYSNLFPLHIISSSLILFTTLLFTNNLSDVYNYILYLTFVISEVIVTDILRIEQSDSNTKKHITISLTKSIVSAIILFIYFVFKLNFNFDNLILLLFLVNMVIILNYKYFKHVSFKNLNINLYNTASIISSTLYFSIYFIDKYLISYDKVYLSKYFSIDEMKILIFLFTIQISTYSLFEGSILLGKYKSVFNQEYKFKSKEIYNYISLIFLISIFTTTFSTLYIKYVFMINVSYFWILTMTITYLLTSTISWYYNLINYSNLKPIKYLIVTLIAAIFYVILIISTVYIKNIYLQEIFYLPIILLPFSFGIINFLTYKWNY